MTERERRGGAMVTGRRGRKVILAMFWKPEVRSGMLIEADRVQQGCIYRDGKDSLISGDITFGEILTR